MSKRIAIAARARKSDYLDVFALGTENQMFHKSLDGNQWHPSQTDWEPLGGRFTSAPAVVSWGPKRLDIFAVGTDNQMFHKARVGNAWHPSQTEWEPLGGRFISAPAVVSRGKNLLDIFAVSIENTPVEPLAEAYQIPIGVKNETAARLMFLVHKSWDGNAWRPSQKGWESLGDEPLCSAPAVASWSQNRMDIFALSKENRMFHKWWDGNDWRPGKAGWEDLAGPFTNVPSVVSWGPKRLDIFTLGREHAAMFHKAWNESAWEPSQFSATPVFGEPLTSLLAVTSWGPNRVDIFALGPENQMLHKVWDGSDPEEWIWEDLGGSFTSAPTVTSWGSDRLDIFALGTENQMLHKAWDEDAWSPLEKEWENLGGVFTRP